MPRHIPSPVKPEFQGVGLKSSLGLEPVFSLFSPRSVFHTATELSFNSDYVWSPVQNSFHDFLLLLEKLFGILYKLLLVCSTRPFMIGPVSFSSPTSCGYEGPSKAPFPGHSDPPPQAFLRLSTCTQTPFSI